MIIKWCHLNYVNKKIEHFFCYKAMYEYNLSVISSVIPLFAEKFSLLQKKNLFFLSLFILRFFFVGIMMCEIFVCDKINFPSFFYLLMNNFLSFLFADKKFVHFFDPIRYSLTILLEKYFFKTFFYL